MINWKTFADKPKEGYDILIKEDHSDGSGDLISYLVGYIRPNNNESELVICESNEVVKLDLLRAMQWEYIDQLQSKVKETSRIDFLKLQIALLRGIVKELNPSDLTAMSLRIRIEDYKNELAELENETCKG